MTSYRVCTMVLLILSCTRPIHEDEASLAYVGTTPITHKDTGAFEFVLSHNTQREQDPFQLKRNGFVWAITATEALYQHGRKWPENRRFRSSSEWEWKKRSYLAVAFEKQILQANCGYSDSAVRSYYQTHRNEFRHITSTENGKACTSKVLLPFDSIRGDVAKRLFLNNYHHDSGSMNLRDPRAFRMFRERLYRDYFMKRYFQERYGKPFRDSQRTNFCGDGPDALFTVKDVGIVLSHLPEELRTAHVKDSSAIIRRMGQWTLFSAQAEAMGFAARPEVQTMLDWALKSEIAQRVITSSLIPSVDKTVSIDKNMVLYSFWDSTGEPSMAIDSIQFRHFSSKLALQKKALVFDSLIYHIRSVYGVRFLKPDRWSDGRGKEPSALLREANALRDSGRIPQARTLYGVLTEYYLFTPEGKKALIERAKIAVDYQKAMERQAIKNFRRFLIFNDDPHKRCEIMFRIAFVYDRELGRQDLAKVNYRWVKEKTPDCSFAEDAAIMLRHLGKSLPDAEELRSDARRRGDKTGK